MFKKVILAPRIGKLSFLCVHSQSYQCSASEVSTVFAVVVVVCAINVDSVVLTRSVRVVSSVSVQLVLSVQSVLSVQLVLSVRSVKGVARLTNLEEGRNHEYKPLGESKHRIWTF